MTQNCIRKGVFTQIVTSSLLHAEIVFTRRLHYRECHPGRAALASPNRTVQLASGIVSGQDDRLYFTESAQALASSTGPPIARRVTGHH
jgi:hypothetical protein